MSTWALGCSSTPWRSAPSWRAYKVRAYRKACLDEMCGPRTRFLRAWRQFGRLEQVAKHAVG